jgi:hypothetical protein
LQAKPSDSSSHEESEDDHDDHYGDIGDDGSEDDDDDERQDDQYGNDEVQWYTFVCMCQHFRLLMILVFLHRRLVK